MTSSKIDFSSTSYASVDSLALPPLLQLPNELILEVGSYLDISSLLNLSMLCRRLQQLMMPSFYKACNIDISTAADAELNLSGLSMLALPGLSTSLSITSLEAISCKLNSGTYSMLRELYSLRCLVSRLSYLAHLKLNLIGVHFQDVHTIEDRPSASQRWFGALAALMNTVIERPETTLTVIYGSRSLPCKRHFVHAVNPRPSSSTIPENGSADAHIDFFGETRLKKGRGLSFAGITRRILLPFIKKRHSRTPVAQSSRLTDEIDPRIHPSSCRPTNYCLERTMKCEFPLIPYPKIKSLHLHTSLLLNDPFYHWTMHTLNSSPLVTLSLDNLNLAYNDVAHILPGLALPHLCNLFLGNIQMQCSHLMTFLARHPTLIVLNLYKSSAFEPSVLGSASTTFLPRLKSITATPEYLSVFLASPEALPSLSTITITSDFYGMPPYGYQYTRFDAVLEHISRRTQETTLSFTFLSHIGLEAWLAASRQGLKTSGVLRSLHHVRNLEFGTDSRFFFSASTLDELIRWLALIPTLNGITFRATCQTTDAFFPSLLSACPTLRRVEVHREVHVFDD